MEDPCFGCEVATVGSPIFEFSHAQDIVLLCHRESFLQRWSSFIAQGDMDTQGLQAHVADLRITGVEWFFLCDTTGDAPKKRIARSDIKRIFLKAETVLDRLNLAKAGSSGE